MPFYQETLTLSTSNRTDFVPISSIIQPVIRRWGVRDGICTLYVPHTTAGVLINEGCDPDVVGDVAKQLDKVIPWEAGYAHMEGNSAAHIKAILVGNSQQLFIASGLISLGQWEEVFFAEFDGPRSRKIIVGCYAD